jgi:drug/metabolite transporter (DMT)-like permease
MSFFLALEQLSVIKQTLLFSLLLPATAAVASIWLKERLPDRFRWNLILNIAGLLVGEFLGSKMLGKGLMGAQGSGALWVLTSISATAIRNFLRVNSRLTPSARACPLVSLISLERLFLQSLLC